MTLAEWCAKYDTKLESSINPMNNCEYHFVYCAQTGLQRVAELYHLSDYHVSAVCGMVVYLIPRTNQGE